jgi:hypothetical protein
VWRLSKRRLPKSVLGGEAEGVFAALPHTVLANLSRGNSENALVWNLIYPLAQTHIALASLQGLAPLWGTAVESGDDDSLEPFYWGFNLQGERLPGLREALKKVDGAGNPTEVDLFLLGRRVLVLVEAKHLSSFGHCHRYAAGRCPEIHVDTVPNASACRYWLDGPSAFSSQLEFGTRPTPESPPPPCDRHYQLGRTLLVGKRLAEGLGRELHIWLILPRERWRAREREWVDFADRVADASLWRRLRVLAWEDVAGLSRNIINR